MSISDAEFRKVLDSIRSLAGETFRTKTGVPFSYSIDGDTIKLENTNQNIAPVHLRKAVEGWPVDGPASFDRSLRASSYLFGMLSDPRIWPG